MARSYHDHENIDIENANLQIIRFDKQQLPENDTNNHQISGTPKPIKESEYKNSLRRKLLREHITSQPHNPDLVRLYTNLDKYPLS